MIGKRIAFLVGAPRSGTTWLQLMLFHTGQVASANETHLFTQYMRSLEHTWYQLAQRHSDNPLMRNIGLHPILSEAEFIRLCRSFANGVLSRIGKTNPDAPIILEKTPSHILSQDFILKLYPRAKFIHLVRDPRSVVASTIAARAWAADWAKADVPSLVAGWKSHVRAGQALAQTKSICFQLRFEDLVADGPRCFKELCCWLGIHITERRAADIHEACSLPRLRSGQISAPWDLSKEPRDFFRSGQTESWTGELSLEDIRWIEREANEEMRIFGYRLWSDKQR